MELKVFRGNDVVAIIQTGGKNARFTHGLMGAHKIVVTDIKGYDAIQVQLEDYVVRKGVKYKINTVPDLNADDQLSYDITFEGPKYTWHDKLFMDEGESDIPDYYGNALQLMQLFLTNINEIDSGWSLGEIADTTEKHLVFSDVYCHEAIILIADAFKLEFQEQDKVISMIPKIGRDTGLSFEYGMGKGLYNLTRTYVNDKNVLTKAYGFGGTRNIPVGYRGAKKRLTFDPGFHSNNTELYGVKEGQYKNEDIIPEREAVVTGVSYGNPLSTVSDTTLDFNVKDCVIEGLEPKIGFTTGDLAGEEFVITDYNPATKVITYKSFINKNNVVLPNDAFKAKVGDKYVFFDIELPATYVSANEARVSSETLQYVMDNSVPRVEYGGTMDPIHLRDNSIEPEPGDRVNFKDARIGLNDTIRITEISMPLDFPEVISEETTIDITIANFVTYTVQQRLRDEKLIQKHEIKTIDIRSAELARRNSANLLNLRDLVIDPEGNYFTDKIKPGSIETLYLAVGAKYTNFSLKNVAFNTNAGGNPNSFTVTAGQLVHFSMNIEGVGFVWEMQPFTSNSLVSGSTYYLYAKVSRATLVGSWVLSTDIKTVESEAGFFMLQTGVLFPVAEGYRNYELTKGMAFIVGDQITAGILKSIDGLNFFDMTQGRFKLGDNQNGLDWNVTTPNRLTIRGGITQNGGGVTAPITLFRGPYGNTITYYKGDTVTYNGETWAYIYPTPIFNVTPVEGAYWTIVAKKGADGASGLSVQFQYSINGVDNWHDTFTTGDIFARSRTGTGAWSAVFRIVGEAGNPGADGKYTDYQFAKNTSLTVAPTTGWQDTPPTITTAEYVWMRTAEFLANGTIIGAWSTAVRISGRNGIDGLDGSDGTPGAPGTSNFFHVAYADSADGSVNFNQVSGKYIGTYVDDIEADSSDYHTYNWVVIKGIDGANGTNGIPGTNGANGQTSYLHIKYSNDNGVTFTPNAGEDAGKYIGQYVDFVLADSNNVTAYKWALIKGADGSNVEIEYSVNGTTLWHPTFTAGDIFMRQRVGTGAWSSAVRIVGEAGVPGTDGKYTDYQFAKNTSLTTAPTTGWQDAPPALTSTEYLWTRIGEFLANGTIIGAWSSAVRISGPQGDPGVAGPPGTNGQSLYTWVKYADNISGGGLSDSSVGKTHIGLAFNKTIIAESTLPTDYTWSLITGQGIPGTPGADGVTLYTWIKYADSPTTGITDSPTGKSYFGIAHNKTTATESLVYADYSWSLIKGADGTNGATGPQGNYTEFRFAKNGSTTLPPALVNNTANPAGWTVAQPTTGIGEYMYMTSALKTAAGALVTNWATPVRFNGADGANGADGTNGINGTNGISSYFHVKYSANANGSPMSDTVNTYIGTVVTNSATAPTDYLLYKWARLIGAQGTNGTNGIPGTNGANGQTSYLHIKYSNDNGATFTPNAGEDVGTHIGQYVDFTLADSNSVSAYTWALIKGSDGLTAFTLMNKANMKIEGSTVTKISGGASWNAAVKSQESYYNGATVTFKHVVGQYMFGLNSDPDAGVSYTTLDYAFYPQSSGALAIYESGVAAGAFGTVAAGDVFSIQYNGTQVIYMLNGVVLRTVATTANRTFYLDSSFLNLNSKVEAITFASAGANGSNGINGTNGVDGTSQYFHVRYSANANGNPMGTAANTYIGTVVTNSATAPTGYASYTWARLIGAQGADGTNGIPGTNGTNGQTSYLHIKYSNNGGTSFTGNVGEDVGTYIGQYVDFTLADSTNVAAYKWALIKGADGTDGTNGAQGPYLTNSGVYSAARTYVGSQTRIEAVQYSGTWYTTRVDAGSFTNILPTNTTKWNAFGAVFDSVATGLLLASAATITNLISPSVKTSTGAKRVEILAAENAISIYSGNVKVIDLDDDSAVETVVPSLTYGPGISVGDRADVNNSSTMGRKMVQSPLLRSGDFGSAYSQLTKTGILTTGNLQADGTTNLYHCAISGNLSTNGNVGQTVTYNVYVNGIGNVNLKFVNGLLVIP